MVEKRKRYRPIPAGLTRELLETSIYNVYWVWSMVAFVLFGSMEEAQRIMQQTALKLTGHEKMARKTVMKVFTDIAADPGRHVETLLQSSYYYEQDKGKREFLLTRKLLHNLREREMLTPGEYQRWEEKLKP